MQERDFQAKLIKDLKHELPGVLVLKNDPNYIQGIPDLTILYKQKWALLEVKKSSSAPLRPNQEYYISEADKQSFGEVIFPENYDVVMGSLLDYLNS